jgi:uncharacterized membrane protein YfcA
MLTACPSCTRDGEDRALTTDVGRPEPPGPLEPPGPRGPPGPPDGGRIATAVVPPRTGRALGRLVVAGSAVGFLTGLFGVGGGFVIMPALTLGLGLSLPTAIGTSLAVIVGNAVVALGFRGLGSVDWGVAVPFALTMIVGTTVGSLVAARVPARRALHGFALLLIAVALANAAAAAIALTG